MLARPILRSHAPRRPTVRLFDDPILIVKVLSPGNEAETWESNRALAPLRTLAEILVVDSVKVEAQVFQRSAAGDWPGEPEFIGQGGLLRLASIGLEVPITEVYRGTHLNPV